MTTSKKSPSLLELVQQIQANVDLISSHIKKNSLPVPTTAADAFAFFPGTGPPELDSFPRIPEDVREARASVLSACQTLSQLIDGPSQAAFAAVTPHWHSGAMQYIYHFQIAKHVPLDGDIGYQDLAANTNTDENKTRRIVRLAVTLGFFQERRSGYVSHTAMSRILLNPDFVSISHFLSGKKRSCNSGVVCITTSYAD
jgi:hypothetical protein